MPSIDKLCERMRYWCDEANLGYCQAHRWDIRVGGEADCSSLTIYALKEAGFDTGSASYTGDIRSNLTARGWKVVSNNGSPKKGDILLNDGRHVAVWLGDCLAEAAHNEKGGITGGTPGDQTGLETRTRSYYNYPWSCYLRYTGATSDSGSTTTTTTNTGDYMTLVSGVTYRCNYDLLYVHSSPDDKESTRTGNLKTGDTITMISTTTKNGYLWGVYKNWKYQTRYVAIKKISSSSNTTSSVSTSVPAGKYKCLTEVNIRKAPSLSGAVSGCLARGVTRNFDGNSTVADGYVWGRYTNDKNYWRYMAVRSTDGSEVLMEKVG